MKMRPEFFSRRILFDVKKLITASALERYSEKLCTATVWNLVTLLNSIHFPQLPTDSDANANHYSSIQFLSLIIKLMRRLEVLRR